MAVYSSLVFEGDGKALMKIGPEWLRFFSILVAWVACAGVLAIPSSVTAQTANEEPRVGEKEAGTEDAKTVPPSAESPRASAPAPKETDRVVRGYRKSLDAALARKKQSIAQVDAVVADDLADFLDPNLAESLQRLPGVAITRVAGEGARVTLRGLPGGYTRTRLNGMDTRIGVGNNTSREFDFNLFASELFTSMVVHKTATADLGDGSLSAVVDLNTGRPFDLKKGFTFVANAQGTYNDFSATLRPRLVGLVGYHDPGGGWGATASAAYSLDRNDQEANDTLRWANGYAFRSVNDVVCANNPSDKGCTEVRSAYHARIPRYSESNHTAERLGVTVGIQYRPWAKTEIRLDALYATLTQRTDSKTLEVFFRANEAQMNVTSYTLKKHPVRSGLENSTLTALSVDNAWVRSETYRLDTESGFHQLTLAIDHEFSANFSGHLLAGTSRAKGHIPRQTMLAYDNNNNNGASYDYSQDNRFPQLTFTGPDVADGRNFTLTELRDRVHTTKNAVDTLDIKLNWHLVDAFGITFGANYKNMNFDTKESQRDGQVCGLKLANGTNIYDCDLDNNGQNDPGLRGPQGLPELTDVTDYRGQVGSGSTTRWASPSLEGWTNSLNYFNVPLIDDSGRIRMVREQIVGAFVQADGNVLLGSSGIRLLYNAGVLYAQTRQTSGAPVSGALFRMKRPTYDDWLPSVNTAVWLTNAWVVRLAAARVMSRPEFSDLSPAGTVDSFNFRITRQNPNLDPTRALTLDAATEWYFADESLISLAVFLKKIDSFPIRTVRIGTFASTGLPTSVIAPTSPAEQNPEGTCGRPDGCWDISELTNDKGATLKGIEVGFLTPFRALFGALPPIIRGLGFSANLSLVTSDVEYGVPSALQNVETFPDSILLKEHQFGFSSRSFNATLYYEDSTFGARLSASNRSYLERKLNINSNLWEFATASTRLDFSSSYHVLAELKVTFDALNLTNTPFDSTLDGDANRRLLYTRTGRIFLLGARYTY